MENNQLVTDLFFWIALFLAMTFHFASLRGTKQSRLLFYVFVPKQPRFFISSTKHVVDFISIMLNFVDIVEKCQSKTEIV